MHTCFCHARHIIGAKHLINRRPTPRLKQPQAATAQAATARRSSRSPMSSLSTDVTSGNTFFTQSLQELNRFMPACVHTTTSSIGDTAEFTWRALAAAREGPLGRR